MTDFISRNPEATKILSEELEKKIEAVNASMVAARDEAERFRGVKNKLEVEIRELETTKGTLAGEVTSLENQHDSLIIEGETLTQSVDQMQAQLADVRKQLSEAKHSNEEEQGKLEAERMDVAKRKADLDGQEAVLRTYAKGLEEKEKKLDVYAERVKRLLDATRPE